jgi:hypothetical protein
MRMDALDRLLAGFAILMSAAALGVAFFFQYGGYYGSAFGRLGSSLGYVFGAWVISAIVAGLILVGGNVMRMRVPVVEIFFTLVIGGCAVSILRALSWW